MSKDVRIKQYDVIKAIAIVLVVFGHSYYLGSYGATMKNYLNLHSNTVILFFNKWVNSFIYAFHMPLYMMVSGALSYPSLEKISGGGYGVHEYICKRFRRLMIPFILVNILYAVPVIYISGYYFDWSYLKALIKSTITLQVPAHLWFIFVVFILDVLCSILAKGKKLYHKGVLPFVLVLFLISGYFSRINAMMLLMKNALWFIMGIWFEKHGIRKKMQMYLREKNRNRFVLSASCFMLIAIVLCQNAINLSIGWLEPLMDSLFIIVSAPIGGLGTYALSDIIVQRGRKNILIDYLSKQSFGIYLFHEPVIHLCVWLYVKTGFVNEMTDGYAYLLSILIRFSVSMAAGILISEVVHNLSIRNIGQHLK